MSEAGDGGPHERLVRRLRQLVMAVAEQRWSEFDMRVPAEPERDADLVLFRAAGELDRLRAENGALKRSRQMDANEAKSREDVLRAALVEARRWIGDGDLSDGLSRDYWTPEYAAAVAMVDVALTPNAVLTGLRPAVVGLNEACPRRSS